jgi:hypothetical protein
MALFCILGGKLSLDAGSTEVLCREGKECRQIDTMGNASSWSKVSLPLASSEAWLPFVPKPAFICAHYIARETGSVLSHGSLQLGV